MSVEQTIGRALRAELEYEGKLTRQVLALVPDDRLDWRPHPKNWTARQLVGHIVDSMGWTKSTLDSPEFDMAGAEYPVPEPASVAAALSDYDGALAIACEALGAISDAAIQGPWTMRNGPKVFFTMPKTQVVRGFVLNHMIHHRAQLMMYLRLMDVTVPAIYGNSADDPGMMA